MPGWEVYHVSDRGKVYSRPRMGTTGGLLKLQMDTKGYLLVTLNSEGKQWKHAYIHHLVLLAFRGPCPVGQESCHNNGERMDNRLENLRYGTRSSNARDRYAHGYRGELMQQSVLTEEAVRDIRKRYGGKVTLDVLAKKHNCSRGTVWQVTNRKTWRHIS